MSSTDTGQVTSLSSSSQPPASTNQPSATPDSGTPAATERKIAVLGPTLRFKGDLSAEEDFIFQGRIQGSIHHAQKIIVGTQGVVAGNIYARVVVIDGNVEGDLHGVESVVVHETGRVIGNIFAPRVGLSDGAVFNGRIDMTGTSNVKQVPTPVPTPVAKQSAANPAAMKRVESPTMNPGQPMSAEETEKVLAPKAAVVVVSPPPRKVG